MRVLLLGATGTIGQATAQALVHRGHEVVCLVRAPSILNGKSDEKNASSPWAGAQIQWGDASDVASVSNAAWSQQPFDALVSCLASRNGTPKDAWAIDYQAHIDWLNWAMAHGVAHFVLLSAICVQKPTLPFQKAKLAFEQTLMASGLTYSIVRPTAFFKSLSGQVKRLQQGKPFLLFGNGKLTACKPISDQDLGQYLAHCLEDKQLQNAVLPIGGPGPAITPLEQALCLFQLMGKPPRIKHVPLGLLEGIIFVLDTLGRIIPALADKAELARIGRYYATESMLVWDTQTQSYDAHATPSFGSQTLASHYQALLEGKTEVQLGEHSVF